MSNNARLTNTDESGRGWSRASSRARCRQTFFLVTYAAGEVVLLKVSLGWTEGALKCHARNCDDSASIEILIIQSVFFSAALILLSGLATTTMFWTRHYRETLCYGLYLHGGTASAPVATRWGSRFSRQPWSSTKLRRPADCFGDAGPVWTCHVRLDQLLWFNSVQFIFNQKISWTSLWYGSNRLSLAPQSKWFLFTILLTYHYRIQFSPILW